MHRYERAQAVMMIVVGTYLWAADASLMLRALFGFVGILCAIVLITEPSPGDR